MADSDPGRGPETAHILLGLSETASRDAVEGAYWRLRGHIEERIRASRDPGFVRARQDELEQLHRALLAIPGATAAEIGRSDAATRRTPRWLIAWAAFAIPLTALLGTLVLLDRVAESPSTAQPPGDGNADLIVTADPAEADLVVTTGDDARVVLSVPADGTPQRLAAGRYALSVQHADCPDTWQLTIDLEPDEQRSYAPKICVGEGRMIVRSNVSGDRVRIDGVDAGSTGATIHTLRVGRHSVTIDKEGHTPWSGDVEIATGSEIKLNAELAALGSRPAAAEPAPPAPPPSAAPSASPAPARTAQAAPGGGAAPATLPTPPPAPAAAGRPQEVAAGMITPNGTGRPIPPRTGKGGSKSWHDAVKQDLISRFDRNGSGSLDTPEEIDAIPCESWQKIEQSYETGGLVVTMTNLYGFDGSEAPANTLGVTAAVRDHTYARMKTCGLKARP